VIGQVQGSAAGLAFEVTGTGPTLVLIHGGSGRRQWFSAATEYLSGRWRCVAIDLPGHGGSRWTTGAYSLDDTAAILAEAFTDVLDGTALVFGHSHGAHVVTRLAQTRPEFLSAFIIGDAPMNRQRMREHHEQHRPMTERWMELARSSDPAVVYDGLFTTPAGPSGTTLGEMFGQRHPYLVEMAASLAAHDPDFLDAVLNRFDDTYGCLDLGDLNGDNAVPIGVIRRGSGRRRITHRQRPRSDDRRAARLRRRRAPRHRSWFATTGASRGSARSVRSRVRPPSRDWLSRVLNVTAAPLHRQTAVPPPVRELVVEPDLGLHRRRPQEPARSDRGVRDVLGAELVAYLGRVEETRAVHRRVERPPDPTRRCGAASIRLPSRPAHHRA
jgi:magnesium chelatase accessory protein